VTVASVALKPSTGSVFFIAQGCAACHGTTGEGTHFAPSLIGITAKFPGDKLPNLLHHPTVKMRNGGMPAVVMNDSQMSLLVAYLSTLGTSSAPQPVAVATPVAPGMPPKAGQAAGAVTPEAAAQELATLSLSPEALIGQKLFVHYSCESCHGIGGLHGTVAAPGLAGTASILPASVLENLLRHHSIQMQKGGMPLTNMNPRDMKAVVAYMRSMPAPANAK
jgi:mono/diheme cytochrome c family protein